MTQEEKAKRYDEAIEKGKQIQNTPYTAHWDIIKEVVEHLLPELKESEDERIKEDIIRCLKYSGIKPDRPINPHVRITMKDALTWLEKQCEHQKFRDSIQVGDKVTRNEDGVLVNLSQLNRVAKKDNKQGEQKPADKVEPKYKVGDKIRRKTPSSFDTDMQVARIDKDYYICNHIGKFSSKVVSFSEESCYELVEQNHAWSGEDEKMLNDTLDILSGYYSSTDDVVLCDNIVEAENWLESIKDRVQPKQEWNEEDEYHRNIILYCLNNESVGKTDKENAISWLKSLGPQNNVTNEELAQAKKEAYNDALDKIEYHSGEPTFDDGWSAAIWYLKKRNAKLQNQWKPSKEQMKFLWKYAEQNNYDGSILTSLYNDLRKLKEE